VNLLYRVGTRLRGGWTWVTRGSLFAALSWAVLSQLYAIYLANFRDLGATYGSLGAAVGLLIYLHLLAWGVFTGAEMDAMRAAVVDRQHARPGDALSPPEPARTGRWRVRLLRLRGAILPDPIDELPEDPSSGDGGEAAEGAGDLGVEVHVELGEGDGDARALE
jgi:hypothetical protein